ncbi:MAG: PTS lactose/cellobiose transporter subunit IIA, partial [Latilactobacillus curvatus]|nr:PTS lactose/cellobiose transporter subunit IIA [Latilactobacillus curvatus]
QDHLMNAITFRDLAGEVVDVYKKMAGVPVD